MANISFIKIHLRCTGVFVPTVIFCLLSLNLRYTYSLSTLSTGESQTSAVQILERHNLFRKCHNAPPLKLDIEQMKQAQSAAIAMATRKISPKDNRVGNVYEFQTNRSLDDLVSDREMSRWLSGPVDSWYGEINFYNNGYTSQTDHFTRLVWKNSRNLGVGIAQSDDGTIYVVCKYDPVGNIDHLYDKNVLVDMNMISAYDICRDLVRRNKTECGPPKPKPTTSPKLMAISLTEPTTTSPAEPRVSIVTLDSSTRSTFRPDTSIDGRVPSTSEISTAAAIDERRMEEAVDLSSLLPSVDVRSRPDLTESTTDTSPDLGVISTTCSYGVCAPVVNVTHKPELDAIRNVTDVIMEELPEKTEFLKLTIFLMGLVLVSLAVIISLLTLYMLFKVFLCCVKIRCGNRNAETNAGLGGPTGGCGIGGSTMTPSQQPPTTTTCVISMSPRPVSPPVSRPASPMFQGTSLTRLY